MPEVRTNPYSTFLEKLEKPARYIGNEHFIIRKDWDKTLCKVALCFPDTYEIGMSHLGFKILYDELNRHDHILAERTYTPWIDMEKEMRERKIPLVSLENYRPLKDFQILGFSLQYEMSYTNILNMLDLGGVSLWQKDRTEEEPFVIAGGPSATHPEPLAPFCDFIVIGDGEDLFVRLATYIGHARSENISRLKILEEVGTWQGIYVPSFYKTEIDDKTQLEVVTDPIDSKFPKIVERFFVPDLKNYPIPTSAPIPHLTAIFDRYSVELARGCTEGCRFCQAGMIYRPVRERRPDDVIKSVLEGIEKGGFNEASLTCLSTADYSAITPLLLELLDKMKEDQSTLGISSLRAYGLDNRIFDKLSEVKNTSLTFAPEAGTERMRKVINKNVSEEDMMKTAEDVFSRGWQKMKLYFMIGLPTETDEDVEGIMNTAKKARDIGRKAGARNPTITVSASSFVPKPHTPFQWSAMISRDEIERKQEMLYLMSRKYKLNFRKHLSKTSYFEGIVSRGDRRVANIIYNAWKGGARFDGWMETFDYDLWMNCLEESGLDPAVFLGTIRMDGRLPWDHINVGLKEGFLEREWKKAIKDRLSPPCGKPAGAIVHHSSLEALHQTHDKDKDNKKLVCYHCGVACDLTEMIEERKDYLKTMKAVEHIPYEKPENMSTKLEDRRGTKGIHIGGFKYRMEFSKLGSISFISHLDLQKVIARIFKRAKIKVQHSFGFNPRPQFSFGPALTLGISSLSEYLDVRVPEEWDDIDEMINKLNQFTELGIVFRNIRALETKELSIQESIASQKYFIPIENAEAIDEALNRLDKLEKIEIQSFSKRKQDYITKDIKPQLLSMTKATFSLEDKKVEEIINEVSPCIGYEGIMVEAKADSGSSIRPKELLESLNMNGLTTRRPIKMAVSLRS